MSKYLFLLDWDDTLFASSQLGEAGWLHLGHEDLDELREQVQKTLKPLAVAIEHLLRACAEYGDVYIVTNAAGDWVEFNMARFLPSLRPIVDKYVKKIVYAREPPCAGCPLLSVQHSKVIAFGKIIDDHRCLGLDQKATLQIVAAGDQESDHQALERALNQQGRRKTCITHSIVFERGVSLPQLACQVQLLSQSMSHLLSTCLDNGTVSYYKMRCDPPPVTS